METAVVSNVGEYYGVVVSFVDDDGSLYMTLGDRTIKKRNLDGTLTLVAGLPGPGGPLDGPAATAKFAMPVSIAKGPDGALYVADTDLIRVIRDGMVTTLAGHIPLDHDDDDDYEPKDGVGTAATIISADDIWFHTDGRLLFWDEDHLREVSLPGGVVTTIGQAGEPNVEAIINGGNPSQACDSEGNCYSAAAWDGMHEIPFFIRKRSPAGANTFYGQIGPTNIPGTLGSETVPGTARFIHGLGSFAYDLVRDILYFSNHNMLRMINMAGVNHGPAPGPGPQPKIVLPVGATDLISAYPIPHDKETPMVDFHGERGFGRYYTKDTYDKLNTPRLNPYTNLPMLPHVPLNPMTRQTIYPHDLTEYIGVIDPAGKAKAATKIQSVVRGRLTRRRANGPSNAAAGGRRKTRRRRTRRTRRHSRR
jgi:IQ calmodulin-binding motif